MAKRNFTRKQIETRLRSLRVNMQLERAGIPHYNGSLSIADPQQFHDAISSAKSVNKKGWMVDVHSVSDYKSMRCYMSADGTAGVAITKDGNIVSVFSSVGGRSAMGKLIPFAVAMGGRKLDCYGSPLATMYSKYGAKPTGYTKFNDAYAPSDWDGTHPDVFAMTLPGSLKGVIAAYDGHPSPISSKNVREFTGNNAYDDMIADRDRVLAARSSSKGGIAG